MHPLPVNNPTYLLAPNWTFIPGGPIDLGNIVADPFRPHLVLSRPPSESDEDKKEAARLPSTQRHTEGNWRLALGSSRNLTVGLWAKFVDVVGVRLGAERSRLLDTSYAMDSLETVYFTDLPSPDYICQRVAAHPGLREIMRLDNAYSRPVYMVTGLKIARGFSLSVGSSSATSASAEVGGGDGEVAAGGQFAASREKRGQLDFSSTSDIVFAYQLMRIAPKGWKQKRFKISEFHSAAAFLSDDNDDHGPEQEQFEAEWDFPDVPELKDLDTEFSEMKIVGGDTENTEWTCISFEDDEDDY
ncbi:hypothetical protein F4801DRAFT_529590 [Xylaria longipes]|nr:hypothetical protein F4801DRAFT_529590 [Xylaria longipes]